MEVQIISKEIIKPSSPTPHHLRTYNLSLLDQLAPPAYIPIILFYSATNADNSHRLKTSFSETLSHFYPFAGRLKDSFSVDCNDEGASFVEANVAGEMSMILEEPDIHELEKLLPCNPYYVSPEVSSQVILAAQVKQFDCGGMAVSVCICHAIADASAVASFLTSWAAIARGASGDIEGVIFDCTSLFPPQDTQIFSWQSFVKEELLSKIMTKRFLLDGPKLAALREKVSNGPCLDRPTRFEAITALMWRAMMGERGEKTESNEINAAMVVVELRKRMKPQLPKLSIGNIYQVEMVNCSKNEEKRLDYNGLAGKLHESIEKMNDEYVRKIHGDGGYFQLMRKMKYIFFKFRIKKY